MVAGGRPQELDKQGSGKTLITLLVVRIGKCPPFPSPTFILETAAHLVSVVFMVTPRWQGSHCCETVPWVCGARPGHADGDWQVVA